MTTITNGSSTMRPIKYSLVARKHNLNSDNQTMPIHIKFTLYGKPVMTPTGEWVSAESLDGKYKITKKGKKIPNLTKWEQTHQFRLCKVNTLEYQQRERMLLLTKRIDVINQEILQQGKFPTSEEIRTRLLGKTADVEPKQAKTVFSLFTDFSENYKGKQRAAASYEVYHSTYNKHFKNFLLQNKDIRKPDLRLSEIKKYYLADFRDYLYKQVSIRKANNMLIAFNKVFHWGVEHEYIQYFPFPRIDKDRPKRNPAISLTPDEFNKFLAAKVKPHQRLTHNLFIMACVTGFAFIDVVNLEKTHLKDKMFEKNRQKNGWLARPLVTKIALKIIREYANHEEVINSDRLFPAIKYHTMRKQLKDIMELAGIERHITFHKSRHTYAVNCIMNGTSLPALKDFLGHSPATNETFLYTSSMSEEMLLEQGKKMVKSFSIKPTTKQKKAA